MKSKIFMYAPWDNVWKRAVRKKSKQSQAINKPIVAIRPKTAKDLHSEANASKENTTERWKGITNWNTTNKKPGNFSLLKSGELEENRGKQM